MVEQAIPTPEAITPINTGIGAGASGLVRVMSNEQLDAARAKEQATKDADREPVPGLTAHVNSCWQAARTAKQEHFQRLIDDLRAKKGEYSPEKKAAIKAQIGGSTVFMNLTRTKVSGLRSWLKDILLSPGDTPWAISPTPNPSMPAPFEAAIAQRVMAEALELQQMQLVVTPDMLMKRRDMVRDAVQKALKEQATKAAARMQSRIDDIFREGKYYDALEQFIDNFSAFHTAFFRGPVKRMRKTIRHQMTDSMTYEVVVKREPRDEWYAPSPFDIYPAPDSRGTNDGYLIERHLLRRSELLALKGVEGYSDAAIVAVLDEHGRGGLYNWLWEDNQRQTMENRERAYWQPDVKLEAIEFHGKVRGKDLIEWGMTESKVDPSEEYEANVWMIGRWVIKATLNEDPMGDRGYHKCSFENTQGAFWGEGIRETVKDSQAICNAMARAIVNNAAIASGPQVEVYEDRVATGETIDMVLPLKIWQTKADPTGSGHKAVNFHQPTLISHHLIRVYEYFKGQADEQSGVPAYVYGDTDVTGAGRTASGLSMLMSGAAKGLRQVVGQIDKTTVRPSVTSQYNRLMISDPDPSIKGDAQVVAAGTASVIAKEQTTIRRQEFLQATTNPIDLQIMGVEGRASLLREIARELDMPDSIVPDQEDLEMQLLVEGPMSSGNDPANPAPTNAAGDRPADLSQFPTTG